MKTTPAQRFAKYFRVFMDAAAQPGERASAERRMDEWLRRHGKRRSDIPSILAQAAADDAATAPPPPPSDPRDAAPAEPIDPHDTVLSLACGAFKTYLALNSHEYVALALWALHTHIFDCFMVTPRLLLTSPVRGCGKSVGLDVLARLVARPELTDNITAAAIYDSIDRLLCTLLLDEFDNQEIATKAAMRAVLNAGYRKGRKIMRGVGKQRRAYRVFAPIAMAAIGILPLPLMSRSIVIRMQRNDRWRELRRFDLDNCGDLDRVYVQVRDWARYVKLDSNPQLPPELVDRIADNWRPLIAIADSFGAEWGRIARATAVFFAKDYREEDVAVLLLFSIREVFDAFGVDRLTGRALLEALHRLEDAGWSEFCGIRSDRPPHKLRNSELRAMLRMFGIESRSVWAVGLRKPGDSSAKGYHRADFEAAWRAYCDGGGKTGTTARVIPLRLSEDE
jgi:Protein of unknown function (DUF3631)